MFTDDRHIIPDDIKAMTLEEIRAEIAEIEKNLKPVDPNWIKETYKDSIFKIFQ